MIILGIDPGLATVGYGVIEYDGKHSKVVDYGVIQTPKEENTASRLAMIDKASEQLIKKFKPDAIAIEELFFNTNVTTAIPERASSAGFSTVGNEVICTG